MKFHYIFLICVILCTSIEFNQGKEDSRTIGKNLLKVLSKDVQAEISANVNTADILDSIHDFATDSLNIVKNGFSTFFDMFRGIESTVKDVVVGASNIPTDLSEQSRLIAQNLRETNLGVNTGISGNLEDGNMEIGISGGVDGLGEVIGNLTQGVKDAASGTLENTGDIVTTSKNNLITTWNNTSNDVKDITNNLLEIINNIVPLENIDVSADVAVGNGNNERTPESRLRH